MVHDEMMGSDGGVGIISAVWNAAGDIAKAYNLSEDERRQLEQANIYAASQSNIKADFTYGPLIVIGAGALLIMVFSLAAKRKRRK